MSNGVYTDVEEALEDLLDIDRGLLMECDNLSIDVLEVKVRNMMEDYLSLLKYYEAGENK